MNVAAISLPTRVTFGDVKLAERLQWILDHRGISASALSLQAGQSRAYVRKLMEREPVRPDFNALERIAEVGKVPPMWLIRNEGRPEDMVDAPRDLTVDRSAADPPPPASRAAVLQRALWDKARELDAEPEDYDAVRAVGQESAQYLESDGDMLGFAESLLRAAISLRRDGKPVNTASILTRVAAGRTFGAEARYEAPNPAVEAMLDDAAAAAGTTRGSKKAQADAMAAEVARKRAKKQGG